MGPPLHRSKKESGPAAAAQECEGAMALTVRSNVSWAQLPLLLCILVLFFMKIAEVYKDWYDEELELSWIMWGFLIFVLINRIVFNQETMRNLEEGATRRTP